MPNSEAQAWWADVQHVRETIERRRAGLADPSSSRDAGTEARFARRSDAAAVAIDDLDRTQASASRAGGRADRATHTDSAPTHTRRPGPDAEDRARARWRRDVAHVDHDTRADRPSTARRHAAGRGVTERVEPLAAPLAPPRRRTVEITGRPVAAPPLARLVEVERRRPPRRTVERVGPRPDRVALWAVLLGFFLILVAATSSRAATPSAHGHACATVALHAPAR
jgi:hypothetical protein